MKDTDMDTGKFFKFCYGAEPSVFTEKVITTPFIALDKFKKEVDVRDEFRGRLYSGFVAEYNGERITVIHCGIGDRLMGDAVLLLEGTCAKKLLFTGTCGGLSAGAIGDFIIGDEAVNGEGFTRYYDDAFSIRGMTNKGNTIRSGTALTAGLAEFLGGREEISPKVISGPVFTIGSLMAETRENMLFLKETGFAGVDMELSSVYKAAELAGIEAAGLLAVSDLPLDKRLEEGMDPDEARAFKKSLDDLVCIAVQFTISV